MAITERVHKRPSDGEICGYETAGMPCRKCGWKCGAVDLTEFQQRAFDNLERAYTGGQSFTSEQADVVAFVVWLLVAEGANYWANLVGQEV